MQGPHWAGLGPAPLSPGHFQEAACFWAQRQVCWFTGSRLAPEVKEAQDGAFRDARPPSSSSMSSGDCSPLSHHQSHPVPVPLLFQPHQPWASGHSLLIHPAGLIPRRLQPISQGRSQPPHNRNLSPIPLNPLPGSIRRAGGGWDPTQMPPFFPPVARGEVASPTSLSQEVHVTKKGFPTCPTGYTTAEGHSG